MKVEEAKKKIRRRIKRYLKNGGRLRQGIFGSFSVKRGKIYTECTCAIGTCIVGNKRPLYLGILCLEEVDKEIRKFGLTQRQVNSFIDGFDGCGINRRSPWGRLGSEIRDEFIEPRFKI